MNWGFPNSVAKVKIKLSYEIGMMNYFENVFFPLRSNSSAAPRVGVAFRTGLRTCWLLAKTVHWTVSLRSALAGLFAISFVSLRCTKGYRCHP